MIEKIRELYYLKVVSLIWKYGMGREINFLEILYPDTIRGLIQQQWFTMLQIGAHLITLKNGLRVCARSLGRQLLILIAMFFIMLLETNVMSIILKVRDITEKFNMFMGEDQPTVSNLQTGFNLISNFLKLVQKVVTKWVHFLTIFQ